MPRRPGIRVAPRYIPKVQRAGEHQVLTQRELAEALGLGLSTVNGFFNGRRISHLNFKEICWKLALDWKEIADFPEDLPSDSHPPSNKTADNQPRDNSNLDALVQEIRQHCHDRIQYLCGTMRMLDISQPVDVNNFYVEVNILEHIPSQQWIEISDLIQQFNPDADDFDRLGLGRVRQQRVPGLTAVTTHSKLMLLGKPGSGKTTFLKPIAIQCNKGQFEPKLIPIFIPLKIFAEEATDAGNFALLRYISQEFARCEIAEESVTERLLSDGRGLILLDGLDEVPEKDSDEVVKQIRKFTIIYYKNRFIITCRIAAQKYRFNDEEFTEVEVADFNAKQIADFAKNWFVAFAKNNRKAGEAEVQQFIEKLNRPENKQIRELAVTPILLHLMCLVFQAKTDFPSNRARLYEQGLEILLKRWDETRGIQRDEVYRSLTLPRKKQLLSQIGAVTFEQGDYFFEKNRVQQLITDYLRSLPDATPDPDELQMDSEALLKAIEAQHGLLVERARGIYSFSHLTFQEYFTAKQIVSNFEPQALEQLLSQITEGRWREVILLAVDLLKHSDVLPLLTKHTNLTIHIAEKRWREIFLLTSGMCREPDDLLLSMKQKIDELIADDANLQKFLIWVNQKSQSVNVFYKPAAVRAFYFALPLARNLMITRTFDSYKSRDLALALELDIEYIDEYSGSLDIELDLELSRVHHNHDLTLWISFFRVLSLVRDPALNQLLQQLGKQLPGEPPVNKEIFQQWWKTNGQAWNEQLQYVTLEHRNIGQDWQFSEHQKELLKQYYEANKLLVDCLNSSCNVSAVVREEIEETLLLPIAEIEKRGNCQDR